MIRSFAHKGLERFFSTGSLAGIQAIHAKRLRLILAMLDEASSLDDMDAPALRLHPLKGSLAGFWAVTVQANWRVIFRFEGVTRMSSTTSTTTEDRTMRMHNPPHPGEILREMWLDPLTLSITEAADALGVSRKTLSEIVNGRASISPEMAVRLEIAFGKRASSWLAHQAAYDLWQVEQRRETLHVRPMKHAA